MLKKFRMGNKVKRIVSLMVCISMVLSYDIPVVHAADSDENPYGSNLLTNPGFEDGTTGWTFYGGGKQVNNPHTGKQGFYLNNNPAYYVKQAVTVPYTGVYKSSVYVNQGSNGASFGIRKAGAAEALEEIMLPAACTYASAHVLPSVMLQQGDEIEVYVNNGKSNWTNGDDFSFSYDFSSVAVDLLYGTDLNEESTAKISLPWSGSYIFTANVDAEEEMIIKMGNETEVVAAGESRQIAITAEECTLNDMLEISVEGTGNISDAELKFDVTSIPNHAPEALNVNVTGDLYSDQTIVGSYDFFDEDEGQTEGTSCYRWLMCDTADGEYEAIPNADKDSMILTDAQDLKYVKFEVTPIDSYGKAGTPVVSSAMGPVHTNLIENGGLELAPSFWYPEGWAYANGASIPNDSTKAYAGFRYLQIPANDADAIGYYTVKIPKNGKYTLAVRINTAKNGGTIGIRKKGATSAVESMSLPATNGYTWVTLSDIALESGTEIEAYVQGSSGCAEICADTFTLFYQGDDDLPEFTTLKSFSVENQAVIKRKEDEKTITVTVPYGTDITALEVTAEVSEGATICPASGSKVDFTNPVAFTITNGNTSVEWVVTVKVANETVVLESDNETLENGFKWASNKMQEYVMTGKSGMINDKYGQGTGPVPYLPSYWCTYAHESGFCTRDFSHQLTAAALTGLWEENYSMLGICASNCTESRGYWTPFGFNFDGSPCKSSFWSEENYLRELPAEFEVIEKAYQAYLWSGDKRLITDDTLWNYYTNVMTTFVEEHDTNGNGVAEAIGEGSILCSYNERSSQPYLESGDAMGAQYQAMLAYAGMLKARGEKEASDEWYQKAQDLKEYFNNDWSVKGGDSNGSYSCALGKDGTTKYNDFRKETSWFMPMKELTEAGERTDAFLDFIKENVGDGIGDKANSPVNIEAWSYLPDVFFPYNRADDAWKYMQYILSVKDKPHEIAVQGTNGDYPEISFTFVSQTITGMMGVTPDADAHKVSTVSRLPKDVGYVKANGIRVGEHTLDVEHDGLTNTTVTNHSDKILEWTAQFYGDYDYIQAGNQVLAAKKKEINGEMVSYATIAVASGESVNAKATEEKPEILPYKDVEKSDWFYDYVYEMYVNGLMTGMNETTFAPGGNLERAQFAVILYRMEQSPETAYDTIFPDVEEGQYYTEAVLWAAGEGIVTGYTDTGRFEPAGAITREQMAVMMYRYAKSKGYDVENEEELSDFPDAEKVSAYAADAVKWCVAKGIITGDQGELKPQNNTNRAECAAMISRFMKICK